MFLPLDGPSVQTKASVTTAAVTTVKVGASVLDERKSVILQPIDGDIYIYFGDNTVSAPSAATVIANGLIQYSRTKEGYEASNLQPLYIVAVTATTNVVIVERA